MSWTNPPIVTYHGCDNVSASAIWSSNIDLGKCRPLTDFGVGFYTTTNRHQANNWANTRVVRLRTAGISCDAVVLELEVDRDALAACETMCFVTQGGLPPASDYWQFVSHCRSGGSHHMLRSSQNYDVVFGLVSLFPQTLVISDCDQISFHSTRAVSTISKRARHDAPAGSNGLFP